MKMNQLQKLFHIKCGRSMTITRKRTEDEIVMAYIIASDRKKMTDNLSKDSQFPT
jgi:hypothetical protein